MTEHEYALRFASEASELERLRHLETGADPFTHERFDRIGICAGWRCLGFRSGMAGRGARSSSPPRRTTKPDTEVEPACRSRDLYDGATFATVEDGAAHAEAIGFNIIERGATAAGDLPARVVYAGFSLGALPAQKLAQTRPGALAAILYHGGVDATTFGDSWPDDVALQVHLNEHDEWSELDVAEALVASAAVGELFTYPGSSHLFTDSSLDEYDPDSANLVLHRTPRPAPSLVLT